ncbi:hypothetical protein ACWC10_20020 [Streptomyces sp. NPDC001595]|uniref:hypothetical protein n=1 Tax=Streptomyces sp. NPDC001532 TaxID=3154520 RepID=UPI00331D773B
MNGGSVRTVPCDWCGAAVVQVRRWRTRRYCSKAHRRRNRIMEAIGNFLDGISS